MIVSKRKEKQKLRQKSLECVRNSERERASPEKASRDRRIMTDCLLEVLLSKNRHAKT